jgi:hypothetical protein
MPTGYTADVQSGKMTTLKEYAIRCARAFGALIHMKEDALDAEIREVKPDTYYLKRAEKNEKRLKEFKSMTEKQQRKMYANEVSKSAAGNRSRMKEIIIEINRYKSMLEKVKEFVPPTPDHMKFKKFMIEQLESSIASDDMTKYYKESMKTPVASFERWRDATILDLTESMKRDYEYWEKEKKSVEERNKWIRQLKEALEE